MTQKCPICNEPIETEHPEAVVYHRLCLKKKFDKRRKDANISTSS